MDPVGRREIRERLRRQAEEFVFSGRARNYSREQREELLQKGYLGCYPPEEALEIARRLARRGTYDCTPRCLDRLFEAGVSPAESRSAFIAVLDEIKPEDYRAPVDVHRPPGIPFVWSSLYFGRDMYFKLRLEGNRPRMIIYSCHPPDY